MLEEFDQSQYVRVFATTQHLCFSTKAQALSFVHREFDHDFSVGWKVLAEEKRVYTPQLRWFHAYLILLFRAREALLLEQPVNTEHTFLRRVEVQGLHCFITEEYLDLHECVCSVKTLNFWALFDMRLQEADLVTSHEFT